MQLLPKDMDLHHRSEHDVEVFDILSQKGVLHYSSAEADSLKEAYFQGKATITMPMQEADPLFAYVSNPGLMEDDDFVRINQRFLPTIKRMKDLREHN
jgi:hypothetical protein